jgi:hypothetical protein
MTDFSKTLIRCSSIGKIMTPPKTKEAKDKGELGETCKTYLLSVYAEAKYGRRKDISTKYTEKGTQAEEEAITLLSLHDNKFYNKNDERLENEYLSGHPDIFEGATIRMAEVIHDTKCSWDLYTFLSNIGCPLDTNYWWQVQGYCDLTGAKTAYVDFCLVNTPDMIIKNELRKLLYSMDVISEESPEYKEKASELLYNMQFDDIDKQERVLKFKVERDDAAIERIYRQVEKCRLYLAEIEEKHLSFNKL